MMDTNMLMLEGLHFAKGIDPVADAFASTVYSDVYNMKNWQSIVFVRYHGVGATGTSTITVEACDNVVPTNVSAIEFYYKICTTGDTEGTLTRAATTGFATTAGSSQIYVIEARAEELRLSGYGFVRAKFVEVVDSPVLGSVMAIHGLPAYAQKQHATTIV